MPTRRIRSGCCARAASGHEVADPAITLMKSRRRIAFTKAGTTPNRTRLQQGFTTGEMGFRVRLHGSNPEPPMSALGQKRTSAHVQAMSALPPKADISDVLRLYLFMSGLPGFFAGTEMPTAGWWEALWPDPAGVLAKVGIRSGMDVIDLCAGDGWFTLQIAKIARRVVGIDIDRSLLDIARHRLAENGVTNCDFIEGDAYEI